MQEQILDFAFISKAIQITYEELVKDGNTSYKGMNNIIEAEKNLTQALSFFLQAK